MVLPQYGLVGSGVLFTREKNEERLAGVLATLEGIDFVIYERNGIVHVANRRGEATIEKRGDEYRYIPTKGDPLTCYRSFSRSKMNGMAPTDS